MANPKYATTLYGVVMTHLLQKKLCKRLHRCISETLLPSLCYGVQALDLQSIRNSEAVTDTTSS